MRNLSIPGLGRAAHGAETPFRRAGSYAIGEAIEVEATFSEPVRVGLAGGRPQVALDIGGTTRQAAYRSGTGTDTLLFVYTVAENDEDGAGVAIPANALALNGGTIVTATDSPPRTVQLGHDVVAADPARFVDTVLPTVASASVAGQILTVSWSEALDETSAPTGAGGFLVRIGIEGVTGPVVTAVAVSGSTTKLTLESAIADGTQNVTLEYTPPGSGPDDDAADDVETLTLSASGADYGDAPEVAVPVTVDDDERAALVLSKTALDVTENEPAVSFTVKLASVPMVPVTVTVTGHAGTELMVTGTELDFDKNNWDDPQTVTVAAGDDTDSAPDPDPVTLTLTPTGAPEYKALAASEIRVTVADADAAGIGLSLTEIEVDENGDARSFTVKLTATPSGDVKVRVTGVSGTDLTVTGPGPGNVDLGAALAALVFTPDDWDTVLVPPNGLALDGGAIRSTAGLDAGLEHTGAGRVGLASRNPLPVLNVADAQASEDETLSFVVTLEPPASAPVTVAYATADGSATTGSDYTAASGTLGFKAGESEKTVTVTLATDSETEGSETLTLTLSAASGATIGDGEATGTVSDPAPPALTARFDKVPEEHDGSSAFDLKLHFSEAPRGLSYRTLSGGSFFDIANGTITKAKRLVKKDNSGWRVTVEPASDADVAIGLAPVEARDRAPAPAPR